MNDNKMSNYDFDYLKIAGLKNSRPELNNLDLDKLGKYINCIKNWESTHNIISGRLTTDDLLDNIFDSVIGGSFLSLSEAVYDAGSGGGFPGIPLAIAFPEKIFHLVESNRKKCSFLRLVKTQLKLENIIIENKRIEQLSELPFIVTKAAFSPQNIGLLGERLANQGKLALWATPKNRESFLAALDKVGIRLSEDFYYELPKGQQRCILLFTKS